MTAFKMLFFSLVIFFEFLSSNPDFIKDMGCEGWEWVTIIRLDGRSGDFGIVCGDPWNCHQGIEKCYTGMELRPITIKIPPQEGVIK